MAMSLKRRVGDRLKFLKRNAFEAARIGGLERSFVNDILIGKKLSVQERSLPKLAKALDWTIAEVIGDAGRLRSLASSFDPDAPDTPIAEDHPPEETPRPSNFPTDAIKELASKAGLGSGQVIQTTYKRDGKEIVQQDEVLDDYWRLPPSFVRMTLGARVTDLLVIECTGDSMYPTLSSGERVIANTAHKKPSPDGLYAIRNQLDDIVVKRLELFDTNPPRVRIISDNPAHKPQERGLDEIEIVGKVMLGLKLF